MRPRHRRYLAVLLAVTMLLTMLSVPALAADTDTTEQNEPAASEADASPGGEDAPGAGLSAADQTQAQDAPTGDETGPSPDSEAEAPAGDGEADPPPVKDAPGAGPTAAQRVQALIDALPAPEDITADCRADVEAQLAAIDGAKQALTDEERDRLDTARYEAAAAAILALDGQAEAADEPMPMTADSNIPYVEASGDQMTCGSATVVENEAAKWDQAWYVAKGSVTISERVTVMGDVNLILTDGCSLTASQGIQVPDGNTLTIWGQSGGSGSLTADGSHSDNAGWYAGIGGDDKNGAGAITINGGVITATGGYQNAGIGSANTFESITINGGTVTANGRVGIGTRGEGEPSGTIEITGGKVTATSTHNDGLSIGIGGKVDRIAISGGTVIANGGTGCAGIGVRDCAGTIEISGGTVTANGGAGAGAYGPGGAGILASGSSSISITGGTVTANGGTSGTGYVYYGIDGSFSMGGSGNAVVYSNEIKEQSRKSWSGVVFEGDGSKGQVYGSPTLKKGFEVKNGQTLTVPAGSTLTVGDGVTLTNNGTIQNEGQIVKDANGSIQGSGRIYGKPVDGYGVKITAPTFENVKYGYAQPAAKAITIQNTGSNTAHISAVELTEDYEAFELSGAFTGDLQPDDPNTSCAIRPKAGLDTCYWTSQPYKATVSVTYDFGCTATADVAFTVDQAEGTGSITMADYTCGDESVTPEAHSETNDAAFWEDDYLYKAKDANVYTSRKPTTAGEYTVKAEFEENENYLGFTATANFKVTHQLNAGWERQEDGYHHTCACDTELLLKANALTDVPAGLASTYHSVEELTQALAEAVDTGENCAAYDVMLKINEADGLWREAAPADFPAEGITVTLPYPEGTDAGYTFTVVHMFAAGENAGQTEKPTVKTGADGITFTVKSLSPIGVGWTAPPASAAVPSPSPAAKATAPNTGDDSQPGLWLTLTLLSLTGLALVALHPVTGKRKPANTEGQRVRE